MVMDPNVFARKFVDAFTAEFGKVGLSDFKYELNINWEYLNDKKYRKIYIEKSV